LLVFIDFFIKIKYTELEIYGGDFMFTDTHCHIFKEYYEDISLIFSHAKESSISRFFIAGVDRKSNEEILQLIQNPEVYGCLGIHPEEVDSYTLADLQHLEEHLRDEKIIGIGEIGLDYHYTKENKEAQIKLFRSQMKLAQKYSLPVVIHSREATSDTIAILKEFPLVKGVIHSFSGSLETANIYIKMGYKLGINGVVTFKNSHLKELLPSILSSIVLETDSPYLTPHPYRGVRNEPKYVLEIAHFICDYLSITKEELSTITNQNISEVFSLR